MDSVFLSCQTDPKYYENLITILEFLDTFETIKNKYNISLSTLYSTDKTCLEYLEVIKNNKKKLIKYNSCSF